jgi:S-formylglutathione hydrolase FrmB
MKLKILLLLFLFCINFSFAQKGKLIETRIPAPSLHNSVFPNSPDQPIAIYLPPSYDNSTKSFPVIYFLPGFGDFVKYWINGTHQGFSFQTAMDKLIERGQSKEMIIVVVNGFNFLGGSFYVNSPVTGNWKDFVVNDVVQFIDKNYRTIPEPESRAITGHSMGASGAINIGMHHPEIFSVVYSLNPGLYNKSGLNNHYLLTSDRVEKYLEMESLVSNMTKESAIKEIDNYTNRLLKETDFLSLIAMAYGAAFAPNPNNKPPYIDYPYSNVGGNIVVDSLKLKKFHDGFGGLPDKITIFKNNLGKLKSLTIEVGLYEEYFFIKEGAQYFSDLLTESGIPHNLIFHDGMHQDKVGERIENYMLPALSNLLKFADEKEEK